MTLPTPTRRPRRSSMTRLFTVCRNCTPTRSSTRTCWRTPAAMQHRSSSRSRRGFAADTSTSSTASFAIRSRAYQAQARRLRRKPTSWKSMATSAHTACFGHRHTGEMLEQLGLNGGFVAVHAAFAAHPAWDFVDHLRETGKAPFSRRVGAVPSRLLCRQAVGAHLWRGAACRRSSFHSIRIFATSASRFRRMAHERCWCRASTTLLKGAAGQAVQNMNLMFGFDEKEGLQ